MLPFLSLHLRATLGQLLGHFQSTFCQLLDNFWTTFGQLSGNRYIFFPRVVGGHSRYADIPISFRRPIYLLCRFWPKSINKNVIGIKTFAPKFCAECTDRRIHSSHGDYFRDHFCLYISGPLSDNFWATSGQLSGNFWPTFRKLSENFRATFRQPIYLFPRVVDGHSRYDDTPMYV